MKTVLRRASDCQPTPVPQLLLQKPHSCHTDQRASKAGDRVKVFHDGGPTAILLVADCSLMSGAATLLALAVGLHIVAAPTPALHSCATGPAAAAPGAPLPPRPVLLAWTQVTMTWGLQQGFPQSSTAISDAVQTKILPPCSAGMQALCLVRVWVREGG